MPLGAALLILAGFILPVRSQAAFFFGPPEAGIALDGNSRLTPFDTAQSARLQQVYSASGFAALVPVGGGFIREINVRVDPSGGHPFAALITNLQINLSTTQRDPDALSPVFAENLGPNDTVALGPRMVGLLGGGGGGQSSFDLYFSLSQPFFYNPAEGNLLVDFRVYTGLGTSPNGRAILDAFDVPGDSVSSVFAFGSSLPSTGTASTLGLATAFAITPVPEPSTWALLALGAAAFFISRKRLWKRKEARHVTP